MRAPLSSKPAGPRSWNVFPVFVVIAVLVLILCLLLLLWTAANAPTVLAASEQERRVLNTIHEIANSRQMHQNVSPADGRLLRLLAESANAKRVIEIGTSTGISGLWLCLALTKTDGKLTTLEYSGERAGIARRNFERAGVADLVTVIQGDAHQTLRQVTGPVDLAFIDADKDGYLDYLKQLLPLMRPGGLILAHNADMVPDYLAAVRRDPGLETVTFKEGDGMIVSMKKR